MMASSLLRTDRLLWLLPVLALLVQTGCAPRPRGPDPSMVTAEAFAAPAMPAAAPVKGPPPVPRDVAAALLPPVSAAAPAISEERFDIAAKGTPAPEFFMSLVAGTPFNMAVHPGVTGTISLSLKNVTVPEVLDVVSHLYGYEYRRTEAGYAIFPAGLQSRVYHVNYLNLVRTGISQTRISSGQVSEAPRDHITSPQDPYVQRQRETESISGSRIDTRSVADFWSELEAALRTIVGSEPGQQVVVQPQAGVVVVRAQPAKLNEVERYLATIQGNLQRQVILEAKIIEVELRDGFQSGINWAALGKPADNKRVLVGQTGGGTIFGSGTSEIGGNTGSLLPGGLLPDGTATSAFGGVFSAALDLNDFVAFIELLETQGDVQVLSSPRIATVNNQKAVIKVGSDEFFVTDVSSTTVTGTTTTTTPDITLTPFFSGIALDVTPQIDPNDRVTLHIHPTVSEVVDQNKTITVAGQTQNLPLAFSSVRESDSIVSAESGQVVVIGGLMKTESRRDRAGIPFLERLPWAGSLFRHSRTSDRKSELVILLRPIVVRDDASWTGARDQARQRLDGLERAGREPWQGGLGTRPGE